MFPSHLRNAETWDFIEENWVSLTAHASNENVPPDLKREINLAHFDI